MKEIIGFIKAYYNGVNKPILAICTILTAILIWLNYQYQLEYRLINDSTLPFPWLTGHFFIYFIAFLIPHLLLFQQRKAKATDKGFIACLLLAPLIFAIKVGINTKINLAGNNQWNGYWNDIIYWPLRMIVMIALLVVCKFRFHKEEGFYGLSVKKNEFHPLPAYAAYHATADSSCIFPA